MHRNSLIQIFSSLTRKEFTYFLEFCHSPYFNKHEGVRSLVTYCSEVYPKFGRENLQRLILWERLFAPQPFDHSKLALIFTYTQRLVEKFLAQELFEEDATRKSLFAAKQLRQRKLFGHAEKIMQPLLEQQSSSGQVESKDLMMAAEVSGEAELLAIETNVYQQHSYLKDKHWFLEQFFLAEHLRDACELLLRSKILHTRLLDPKSDFALAEVRDNLNKYASSPLIYAYFLAFSMIESGTNEDYLSLKHWIKQNDARLRFGDLQNLYNYLQNHCVSQINRGNQDFHLELFEMYTSQLSKELIFEDGFLHELHYKNIVSVAIRVGKMDWVESFIENFKSKLKPSIAEDAYRLNLASVYYAQNEPGKVLELLLQINTNETVYALEARTLLLRSYFDMGETEALISLCDSFRQLVQRNKLLSDSRKKGYLNFLKFAKRLGKIKDSKDYRDAKKSEQALLQLELEVRSCDPVFIGTWLLQKIAELRQSIRYDA